MKVCIIQPKYEMDHAKTPDISAWILDALDRCDPSMDLIVLPEYSDVPCATTTMEETLLYHNKYMRRVPIFYP